MINQAIKKSRGTKYRGTKGSIAFGVVLAFILVILGVGFMAMMLYMGGQNETKNAVDAGALNIGKQVVDKVSTGLSLIKDDERMYYDVTADKPNKFPPQFEIDVTLRKINRVWAKALLIGINADAAKQDGNVGSGLENAQKAIKGAEGLSDDLQKEIIKTDKWRAWFDEIAKQNSVRMLGKDAKMVPLNSPQWQNSCMMRGAESNIQLVGEPPNFNLPPGYTLSDQYYTTSTREPKPPGSEGRYFLKGYTPITVAGETVWQIPFPYDEKTHLVSGPKFEAEKPSAMPLSWKKPIPNAFSASGDVVKSGGGLGQHASSWVIANPHEPFKIAIPHSFLKIHVEKPKTHWKFFPYVDAVECPYGQQEYDFTGPTSQTGPAMPLGGVGCSVSMAGEISQIGNDVFGRTLDMLLFPPEFALGDNDMSKVEAQMVGRINEMVSDVGTAQNPAKPLTADDLHKCLNNPLTILYLQKWQDLYIYSPDGKSIICTPKEATYVLAPWLTLENDMISNEPDGTEKKIIDDNWIIAPIPEGSPTSTPLPPFPVPWVHLLDLDWGTWDEDVYWTPGSGYNGSLGTIRLDRYTEIFTLSIWV
ncbi:hypothetical protein BH10CYA1_BH10CYA1_61040 [soil metagenome]